MAKVRTRKRGKTYSYIFEAGKTAEGKRHVIEKGGFESEDAAYEEGLKAYTDWKHGGIGITNENLLVSELLTLWYDQYKNELSRGSQDNYERGIRILKSLIGHIPLEQLRPRDIDFMLKKLASEDKSQSYLKHIKSVLNMALSYAVYPAELIKSNPATEIHIPKNTRTGIVKRVIVTPEKFAEIIEKFPFGTFMHIIFMLAYHTGMRISEICGLTWENVDLTNRIITVKTQLVYVARTHFFKGLKTDSSYRTIYIDSVLAETLTKWKTLQQQNKERMQGGYLKCYSNEKQEVTIASSSLNIQGQTPINLVVTDLDGRPVHARNTFYYFKQFGLNAHSFRHTHATMLAEAEVGPKEVAARLGHSKIDLTMNLYTKTTEKMLKNTSSKFEQIIKNNADKDANADKKQTN
ncbi:Site-specific recombinase XerC [Anaerovibrio lipolyticus DSM 3074]|uniref:Site-specific recombinase XerC n=1 Tax=Anaerovibrio lipolyticus DSM 3074 TaxID=1120997 RepID=A0A1M6C4M1_9FIRM|nr:site-specific integrase [Anaerovibrio lipolyticus]SHI55892.1 Site-specific recombinase XerC [Anaerovibrio lipolyticus DSM 3074]